jgi:hypothetical protein
MGGGSGKHLEEVEHVHQRVPPHIHRDIGEVVPLTNKQKHKTRNTYKKGGQISLLFLPPRQKKKDLRNVNKKPLNIIVSPYFFKSSI